LNDVLARWKIDVIESPNWDAEGILCLLEHRAPTVVRVHSPLFKVMETQRWPISEDLDACCELEGLLIESADAVSGSTHAILRLIDERYELTPRRTARIPLGINVPTPAPSQTSVIDPVRLLFVGRLEPRKGIATLLEALPDVIALHSNVVVD